MDTYSKLQEPAAKSAKNMPDEELALFQSWLEAGLLPEVQPSVQPRSIRTAWTLIQAGEVLLNDYSFDALSVEDVCAKAGTTVGGFYGRFQNKQAFFLSMQRVVLLRSELAMSTMLQEQQQQPLSLRDTCFRMVEATVKRFRQHRGVLRSSLQHAHEGMWEPFKETGSQYRRAISRHLAPHLDHLSEEKRTLRIQFAHQCLIGVLVHAILNDPGPVHLNESSMIEELGAMLYAYLTCSA